jgi:N-acetyl-gamma-glutamyl-phosphate reductase
MQAPVGIIGASGYTGLELTRLLAAHPGVSLRFATSDRWVGESLSSRLPGLTGPARSLRYVSNTDAEQSTGECALVLLATPAETSLALAPSLLEQGTDVIDLSGAFRLADPTLYPTYYGWEHRALQLLSEAVYGLPELSRQSIRSARLVANPGCFATAVTLALAPLLAQGLLAPGPLIADAASGVTGAGRKGSEEFSFAELVDDFHAYKTLRHQHTPEIRQALAAAENGKPPRPLTFTPHLLPLRRGILATCYAQLQPGATAADVGGTLEALARSEPFVRFAASPDRVSLRSVVGTNLIQLGAAVDEHGLDPGRVVVAAALDNLLKGAAGQAIQNLNLMLGLPETLGIDNLQPFSP